jgi:hypothetical protein
MQESIVLFALFFFFLQGRGSTIGNYTVHISNILEIYLMRERRMRAIV